jgi:hypothetical protein
MLKNEGSIWELTSINYEFSDEVRIGKHIHGGLWNKQVYLSVFKKHLSLRNVVVLYMIIIIVRSGMKMMMGGCHQ